MLKGAMTSCNTLDQKKDDHKLSERKRRHDMKSLCSLLTSFVPPQNLKGKRSLPDRLSASATYIRDLRKNLEELEKKRERLRILYEVGRLSDRSPCAEKNVEINVPIDESNPFPAVRLTIVGSEIQVSVNTFKQQVELCSILEMLEQCGTDVESALVSTVEDKVFYTIQCKISDAHRFDCNVTYGRIWHLVKENNSMVKLSSS